jgi:molecular chaperone GrpE
MNDTKDTDNETKNTKSGPAVDAASADAKAASQASPQESDSSAMLEELRIEHAELKDKLLRILAEMENLRRRTERDIAEVRVYAVTSFARDMLTLADNLRRALESVPPAAREEAGEPWKGFVEGIEVTERDFLSRLSKYGVKKLEPLGTKFDPHLHEALFEVPDEAAPNGTVVQVIEDGYVIGDRVLRPAKVGVARGSPKAANENAPA